jgi:hypothetical protein
VDNRDNSQPVGEQSDAPPQWIPDGEADPDSAPTPGFNYFNYFTEVEDEFVRRRGKHLLVSPIDWALVESWKDAGIPLAVVIRGISRAFDAFEARPAKSRKVNSILYCEQAVEETYAEYQLARVGGVAEIGLEASAVDASTLDAASSVDKTAEPQARRRSRSQASSFTAEAMTEFLDRCEAQLADGEQWLAQPWHVEPASSSEEGALDARPSASRDEAIFAIRRVRNRLAEIKDSIATALVADAEAIEVDLCALDNMLFERLKVAYGSVILQSLRQEAEIQLKGYKAKMDEAMYERTLENFVGKRLRSNCRVPRLSLFYM